MLLLGMVLVNISCGAEKVMAEKMLVGGAFPAVLLGESGCSWQRTVASVLEAMQHCV